MIKDVALLAEFDREQIQAEKLTYAEALAFFEAMWQEGIALGVLPLEDPRGYRSRHSRRQDPEPCLKN